jgi:ferredoxin
MPVVRFVREAREVVCAAGANLRELALAEGIQLYGLKGQLGNCGGCGQCITCFVEVVAERVPRSLNLPTPVELQKLRRRPEGWRLACQTIVFDSIAVVTRPQMGRASLDAAVAAAQAEPLPLVEVAVEPVEEEGQEEQENGEAPDDGL